MNAINWMRKNAELIYESDPENFDGQTVITKTYQFNGTIPARMIQEIKKLASLRRDTRTQMVYSHDDELSGWSVKVGGT